MTISTYAVICYCGTGEFIDSATYIEEYEVYYKIIKHFQHSVAFTIIVVVDDANASGISCAVDAFVYADYPRLHRGRARTLN